MNFIYGVITGFIAAEALYLFRKVIAAWASAKIAKAQAAIDSATTPKA